MKKINQNSKLKKRPPSFQSDIVIDEDGDIYVSFLGPELLHLASRTQNYVADTRSWKLNLSDLSESDPSIEYSSCEMCPKECGFNRVVSSHPTCGDASLKISNFGISFGDEPEISEGGGSGVIFLSGCPLTCPSCINPEKVQQGGTETSIEEFLLMCESLYHRGASNIQILSPTVHLPKLITALRILKHQNFPLPLIFKSSGYEKVSELKKFEGLVDIYLPDFKFSSSCFWKSQAGVNDYHEVFIKCLQEMFRQVGPAKKNELGLLTRGVLIRHVNNPYLEESEKKEMLSFLQNLSQGIQVSYLDNFVVLD